MKSLRIVSAFLLICALAPAQQYLVSTVAGTGGSAGWSGDAGPATQAQLNNPVRVSLDKAGNIYITDYTNYSVRKVNVSNGTIDTLAGRGAFGFSGDGDNAKGSGLSNILDVAVDQNTGDVFIADSLNSRVRWVTPSGIITTYAGNGSRGYSGDGGAASAAALYFPSAVALDSAGNLYIADYGNATVRKVNRQTKVITTVAGVGYSIYANMLNVVAAAKLTHGIRGVLWHQGESDGSGFDEATGNPYGANYQQMFVDMSAAWKQDFPNLRNYYIYQVWGG